jgi:hypothetical protein
LSALKALAGNICSAKLNHIGSEEEKGDNKRGLFINSETPWGRSLVI